MNGGAVTKEFITSSSWLSAMTGTTTIIVAVAVGVAIRVHLAVPHRLEILA